MNENQLVIQPLNAIFYLVGIAAGVFLALEFMPFSIGLGSIFDLLVLTVAMFLLSIIFSSYLTPLVFLYLGAVNSSLFFSNPIGLIAYIVPLVIASYAGGVAASSASMDFNGEGNFFDGWKGIAAFFGIAVFLALVLGAIMGFLPSYDSVYAIFFG